MGSTSYLPSPTSHRELVDDGAATSEVTVCRCQDSSRRRRVSVMNTNNTLLIMIIMPILLSYFACCVSAWPMLNHRRSYSYALPIMPEYDLDANQWALASQPVVPVPAEEASIPDAYYDIPALNQDSYDDTIYEDPEETYQMPVFGPIMDPEPEEELELEELKHQQPYIYEKRTPTKGKPELAKPSQQVSSTLSPPSSTESTPTMKSSTLAPVSSDSRKHPVAAPLRITNGQKEIAMLRPPAMKSHHTIDEPEISVSQRSVHPNEMSAYDRLRKYLSIEDTLKQEYQQRRANSMNRHAKRDIITESDNLAGQLNGLKKKVD